MSGRRQYILLMLLVWVFGLSGCGGPRIKAGSSLLWDGLVIKHQFVDASVEKRPIDYLEFGNGRDVTFILAGIHGDEQVGITLGRELAEYLENNPDLLRGRKVVLLPEANPDGVAANTRCNIRSVDLNRNFPADNRIDKAEYGMSPLCEPESVLIAQIIRQYRPARIISIHESLGCIDYDGPAKKIANRMSLYCDLPVRKLGSQSGSLGSYAGLSFGIPIITFELAEEHQKPVAGKLWERYGKALVAVIIYPEKPG